MSGADERLAAGEAHLTLRRLSGETFAVRQREGAPASWPALAAALHARVAAEDGGSLIGVEREGLEEWNAALLAAGFRVHRRKLLVIRDLTGELPPFEPFTWQTMAECGVEAIFDALVAASEGDVFEDLPRDCRREWDDLVEHAGDRLDRSVWRRALVDGQVVGVVLPTLYAKRTEGTLSYVGVLPAARGRGYGTRLHAAGLALLRDAGATRYYGSTDDRNAAMARVFERNGCPVDVVQLFLRPAAGTVDGATASRG